MKKRKIPTKNYIIASFIVIITIVLTLFLASAYTSRREYENSQNIRMKFLKQVDEKSIENYIIDNRDTMIYLSNSSDSNLEDYERQLKRMLVALEYEKDIVYFDTKNMSLDFYDKFKKNCFSEELQNTSLIEPNLLIVEDGKVNKVLYINEQELRASDLIKYISNNMVEE